MRAPPVSVRILAGFRPTLKQGSTHSLTLAPQKQKQSPQAWREG